LRSTPPSTTNPRPSPRTRPAVFAAIILIALGAWFLHGCGRRIAAPPEVVVFVATDRVISDPILQEFEKQTGVRVRPVFDAEAAKTTGLITRLIARKDNPECDVLWNNEIIQTAHLTTLALLEPYDSPSARRIPEAYRDPAHRWTGFSARMRLLLYNTNRIKPADVPRGINDLIAPKWKGQAAIARPYFGTTFTHMLILHQTMGDQAMRDYLGALRANDVALAPGNGAVRDLVASGERAFGLADTDDVREAVLGGKPVGFLVPDAAGGAILIPNTVAIVRGCPHPDNARRLVDFLLSAQVERMLAEGDGAQVPLGTDLADLKTPWDQFRQGPGASYLHYDPETCAAARDRVVQLLNDAGMDR
jgi:iron(III) transport system substrate-binding protein